MTPRGRVIRKRIMRKEDATYLDIITILVNIQTIRPNQVLKKLKGEDTKKNKELFMN